MSFTECVFYVLHVSYVYKAWSVSLREECTPCGVYEHETPRRLFGPRKEVAISDEDKCTV
jgi:hypothetical protein